MASITVVIKTSDMESRLVTASNTRHVSLTNLANILKGINGGSYNADATVDVAYSSANPVAASGSIAVTNANVVAGDTLTIGGVVLTAAASGNGTTSFTIGADATATGNNIAACINANTTLNKVVSASNASGTVTVRCLQKGLVGNLIVISTSKSTAFALTQLAGGTGGVDGAFTSY